MKSWSLAEPCEFWMKFLHIFTYAIGKTRSWNLTVCKLNVLPSDWLFFRRCIWTKIAWTKNLIDSSSAVWHDIFGFLQRKIHFRCLNLTVNVKQVSTVTSRRPYTRRSAHVILRFFFLHKRVHNVSFFP